MQASISKKILGTFVSFTLLLMFFTKDILAATPPTEAIQQLLQGNAVDLIVEYEDTLIEKTASKMRDKRSNHTDDETILLYKSDQYRSLKNKVNQSVTRSDIKHLQEYQHLPMSLKRFSSKAGLDAFLATSGVKAV